MLKRYAALSNIKHSFRASSKLILKINKEKSRFNINIR